MDEDDLLYSQKQQTLRGERPDTVSYDVPKKLRKQAVHLLVQATGSPADPQDMGYGLTNPDGWKAGQFYREIRQTLCSEYGEFSLADEPRVFEDLCTFFLEKATDEQALDVIELAFRHLMVKYTRASHLAINELNRRFRQNGIGFEMEMGNLLKKDSDLLHQEAVRPALHLLSSRDFSGAEQEYLSAHEHFRHGRHKECLVDCLKSLESTLKTICDKKGWAYKATDTAKALIAVCKSNKLFPPWVEQPLIAVATVRNKLGGHGQGASQQNVPPHLCSYAVHLTAVYIKLLVDASGL